MDLALACQTPVLFAPELPVFVYLAAWDEFLRHCPARCAAGPDPAPSRQDALRRADKVSHQHEIGLGVFHHTPTRLQDRAVSARPAQAVRPRGGSCRPRRRVHARDSTFGRRRVLEILSGDCCLSPFSRRARSSPRGRHALEEAAVSWPVRTGVCLGRGLGVGPGKPVPAAPAPLLVLFLDALCVDCPLLEHGT